MLQQSGLPNRASLVNMADTINSLLQQVDRQSTKDEGANQPISVVITDRSDPATPRQVQSHPLARRPLHPSTAVATTHTCTLTSQSSATPQSSSDQGAAVQVAECGADDTSDQTAPLDLSSGAGN